MAEPLSQAYGDNRVDIGMALDFHDQYDDADQRVDEAVAARKDLRKSIKAAGINLKGFDRARRDRTQSGEEREAEQREYLRQMAWLGKPIGAQAGFDFDETVDVHELHRIDAEGELAGKTGTKRSRNPWSPGTEAADRWDTGWRRGDASRQQDDGEGEEPEEQPQRRRGRPLGSKNRPKLVDAAQ